MWSSKMAARWRGDVVNLNAGNGDFVSSNSSSEFVLSRRHMDGGEEETQSCMDQSILAIFEESPVSSEDRGGVEEENEKLLSALTEMLDSVEDDDGTLSPFDTVPDTKLLTQTDPRNISEEPSLADRLRPRSKLSNETFPVKIREEKKVENRIEKNGLPKVFKQPQGSSFNTRTNKKREAELDVFTTATLVNLVKLMHPYCLKLHVEEEGDKLRRNHTFFSQEEVWKYERPTEDSHEEIDVVSDEEATVKMTNEGEGARDLGKHLKSALLKRNSSREKKRVSFGPVEVASLDGSSEMHLSKKNMKSSCTSETVDTQALEDSPDSACEAEMSAEMNIDKKVAVPHKSPTKARSLSLQQYRQLRQQRQPLVEKQGNYTTKWPSVPHTPLELTPILCLQGQRLGTSRSEPSHHHLNDGRSYTDQLQRSVPPGHASHLTSARPHFKEAKPSTPPQYCKPKRPRTESKAPSPASPLPSNPVNPNLVALESKTSPVKLPTPVSSDPPNPVLLTLLVSRTSSPSKDQTASGPDVESPTESNPDSTSSHFHEIQSSGTSLELQTCLSGPNSEMTPGNEEDSASFQDIQSRLTKIVSGDISRSQALCTAATLVQPSTSSEKAQPVECTLNPGPKTPSCQSLTGPTILVKERLAEVLHPKTLPVEPLPTAAVSGIEATDLTSLLEQFEETQAKQKKAEPFMELLTSRPPSDSPRPPNTLRDSVDLQTPEAAQVPEPLGNEIILSAQQDLPARRKNTPSKAIQIIDPRPLPSKKTHNNLSERPNVLTSPHLFSSISSDHDYCGPADRFLAHIPQCVRSSKSKDSSKITESLPDIKRQTESKQQTSSGRVLTSVTTTDIPSFGTQHLPAESRNGPETAPSTDMLLTLSHSVAMEPTCKSAAKHKVVPCTLPTPPPSPPARGRDRRRHRRSSPRSDSSSSSCSSSPSSSSSCSPSPKRRQHKHSESSSCSSSPSRSVSQSPPQRNRWSRSRRRCSRSRSRSWSQSRSPSRSPPPLNNCRQWRDIYNSRKSRRLRREHELRIQKLKAIDERRVVYVGRICRSMTHDELRERFSQFGEVECVSLHFRERGDHYGFVTFYNMNDAFAAIDNGSKLRRPDELPFDLCFGGRRQFCNSDYADLDANRDADLSPARSKFEDLDFDQLLKQAQRGMNR